MTPDIDTLTPPCCLSSLALPLLGHQLWRGIDGSAAQRVAGVPQIKGSGKGPLERMSSPLLCDS